MPTFKDRTFCASPGCQNECGRKMAPEEEQQAKESPWPVAYGYFCGAEPQKAGE